MHTAIYWNWLGLQPIEMVLYLQNQLFQQKCAGDEKNYLLFAEHPHCFTYSRKPIENQLRVPLETFGNLKIPSYKVERGGEAMYHGPGQLLAYWVIDVTLLKLDILAFNASLANAAIRLLKSLGIYAAPHPASSELSGKKGTAGVWVQGKRKILSRGIRVTQSPAGHALTQFGCAFNVATDLNYFSYIFPCGLDIEMTSLAEELGIAATVEEAVPLLLQKLGEEYSPYAIGFKHVNLKPLDYRSGFHFINATQFHQNC